MQGNPKSMMTVATVLIGAMTISGCSSDSAPAASAPAIPDNSVTIDATNAYTLAQLASVTGFALAEVPENNAWFDSCLFGTSTSTVDIASSGMTITNSGVISFAGCGVYVSGFTDTYQLDGNINYSSSATFTETGSYSGTDNISGVGAINITTQSGSGVAVMITDYRSSVTGSADSVVSDATYSINVAQFAYDSADGNSFAVQLTTPITGVYPALGSPSCPTGGVILVSGADGTQAKATFNANGSVLIEYDTGAGFVTEAQYSTCNNFIY